MMKWPHWFSSGTSGTAEDTLPRPTLGEQTTAQVDKPKGPRNIFGNLGGFAGDGFKGFDPPPPGTFDCYRAIGKYPTAKLGLGATLLRISGNKWNWCARDDADDDLKQQLEDWFTPLRQNIVRYGMNGLKFGFSPFEEVWQVKDGLMLPTLKPLRVDYTQFLQQESKGIVGLQNKLPNAEPVKLGLQKCFWFTFDDECGDPYGESLFEGIREIVDEARQIRQKISKYVNKVSGVIGQIHYPDGTSKDAAGADRPNFWIAQQLAKAASDGKWLVFNNKYASFMADPANTTPATIEKALATAGKSEWVVDFVDPGGTDHSEGFIAVLQYYDSLIVRGLMQPERGLLEGQHGTKAEAGVHGEIGVAFAEMVDRDFARAFSTGVLDDVLEFNRGPGARGSIYVEPAPMADDEYDAKLKTVLAMIASPTVGDGISMKIDVDGLLEDLGIPITDDEDMLGPLGDTIMLPPALGKQKQGDDNSDNYNGNGNGDKTPANSRMR